MVKNGKKDDPKQCARIVKRVVSYAKRHRAALRAARRASQKLTAKQRKRMNRRAQQLYNSLFSTYGEAVVELGQNCHGALHQIEHVIDGLMQLKPPGKGQSTGHDHGHHDQGHHDPATGH
jgi:hypothetical protein